jgi:hypothetical protein
MKVIALTSEPISADQLREAIGDGPQDVEVMVIAPALHESALRFWVSDADEAIARAERVESESVQELRSEGVQAAGDTGESEPAETVRDVLRTFPADRILMFVHRPGKERYREGVEPQALERDLGVPVLRVEVEPGEG